LDQPADRVSRHSSINDCIDGLWIKRLKYCSKFHMSIRCGCTTALNNDVATEEEEEEEEGESYAH
jgi:hypothetical protein